MSLTSGPVAKEPDPQPDPKQFSNNYLVRAVFDSQAEAVLCEKQKFRQASATHSVVDLGLSVLIPDLCLCLVADLNHQTNNQC